MTLENFTNQFESIFQETFTDLFVENVIQQILENRKSVIDLDCENQFGIYVFFYKPQQKIVNVEQLQSLWNNEEGYKNYSKVIKKNFDDCTQINNFYTFYVGKSEKVKTRLHEHLTHDNTHSTYGLKLKDRKYFSMDNFEIGYWLLPIDDSFSPKIKQFIITTLEQKVRTKLKPLIGKQ